MTKKSSEDELIALLPLERTWLDDLVDVLLHRPEGVAEVAALEIELRRRGRNLKENPEQTITRTMNSWTVNSRDVAQPVRGHLFERIAPGTWRLIGWPEPPDLIEVQQIRFSDHNYKRAWDLFVERVEKRPEWADMSKRRKLAVFAHKLLTHEGLRNYLKTLGGHPPEK